MIHHRYCKVFSFKTLSLLSSQRQRLFIPQNTSRSEISSSHQHFHLLHTPFPCMVRLYLLLNLFNFHPNRLSDHTRTYFFIMSIQLFQFIAFLPILSISLSFSQAQAFKKKANRTLRTRRLSAIVNIIDLHTL